MRCEWEIDKLGNLEDSRFKRLTCSVYSDVTRVEKRMSKVISLWSEGIYIWQMKAWSISGNISTGWIINSWKYKIYITSIFYWWQGVRGTPLGGTGGAWLKSQCNTWGGGFKGLDETRLDLLNWSCADVLGWETVFSTKKNPRKIQKLRGKLLFHINFEKILKNFKIFSRKIN